MLWIAKKPKLEHEKQGYDHNIASFLEQQFSTSINSKDKAMEMLVDGCIVVLDEDLQVQPHVMATLTLLSLRQVRMQKLLTI